MKGGRFAPLTIMSNDDTDIDSMLTTFDTALTGTASKILGKNRQKKQIKNKTKQNKNKTKKQQQQKWITAEILDLCDKKERTEKEKI